LARAAAIRGRVVDDQYLNVLLSLRERGAYGPFEIFGGVPSRNND
jgi:hypothetical protein